MTTTVLISRLLKQGKQVIQNAFRVKVGVGKGPTEVKAKNKLLRNAETLPNNVIQPRKRFIFGRIFPVDPVRTLASELRRRAATSFGTTSRVGQTFVFAFAGIVYQGRQQQEEVDSLSEDVREIFHGWQGKESILNQVQNLSLDVFDFGRRIGQGCNAAVYEAKLKTVDLDDAESIVQAIPNPIGEDSIGVASPELETVDYDDDIVVLNDLESDVIGSEDKFVPADNDMVVVGDDGDLPFYDKADEVVVLHHFEDFTDGDSDIVVLDNVEDINDDTTGIQEEAYLSDGDNTQSYNEYSLAIKMMFNYDIESNADSIMRAMLKEAVPARLLTVNENDNNVWHNGNRVRLKPLPEHPNIVEMVGVFVDPLPNLPDALSEYPAALPQRLNPNGLGRNLTMFLVMKKYDLTLRQYLEQGICSSHTRCLLLCQLLEGTLHLKEHEIAHRDMKSDNILLDCHSDASVPHLVISDFGCCLADRDNGLKLPYTSDEINKGGNGALMPPEIACTAPGHNVKLDYSKSDLWAVGSLVYEVFGLDNPFYRGNHSTKKLDSRTYQNDDLPSLSGDVPDVVKFLVPRMLQRNPKQRPEPKLAANLMQIFVHYPEWLQRGNKPTRKQITDNLMILVTKILIGLKLRGQMSFKVEEQLSLTFLRRLVISDLEHALDYYHGN